MPTGIVFGAGGQIGSYMVEHLLKNDYKVVAVVKPSQTNVLPNLQNIVGDFDIYNVDITDSYNVDILLRRFTNHFGVTEIYNFAAQSHVQTSFDCPSYTVNSILQGTLNILNFMAKNNNPYVKLYHSSSSEQFGSSPGPQAETTRFSPNSPYGVAKMSAHHMVDVYRKSHRVFACNGILFNTESPRRGLDFVTRKITDYVGYLLYDLSVGNQPKKLKLGNICAKRDWGYAGDAVQIMHKMLQEDEPDDYVIGTGEVHSVQDFLHEAFSYIEEDWKEYVEIDDHLKRLCDVPFLQADPTKIREKFGWKPTYSFKQLVRKMVDSDIKKAFRNAE